FLAALAQQADYARDAAQIAHQSCQVDAILDLHRKAQMGGHAVVVFAHADIGDVGIGFADFGGDTGQYAALVMDQQLNMAIETAVQVLAPSHIDPAVGFLGALTFGLFTVFGMHHQALIALEQADNAVARDRQATRCQLDRDAFAAIDHDRFRLARYDFAAVGKQRYRQRFVLEQSQDMARYQCSHAFADADIGVDVVQRLGARFVQQPFDHRLWQVGAQIEHGQR